MKQISPQEHKSLTLSLLISFAEVCEKNNFRYFLDYGTLIGAVRHNGYIPWDDDIDVSMPREDYEKIITLFMSDESVFGENYKLASYRTKYNIYKPFLNLVDIRTITKSSMRYEKYDYPIWIDILPMDNVCNNDEDTEKLRKRIHLIKKFIEAGTFREQGKFKGIKKIYKRIQRLFIGLYLKKYDRLCTSNSAQTDMVTLFAYSAKCTCPVRYFDEYEYHQFEGYSFRIPKEYDIRLSQIYGDYMTLPPVEERVPHITESYWI